MPDQEIVRLSDRMTRLPPYLFGLLNKKMLGMRRDGADVIDMAMGNPTDSTPEPIIDKLCEVVKDPRNHRYSAAAGIYNLRREMARHYAAVHGVDLDPETEVIATIGSKEGFSHLCLAMIGAGDTALVQTPYFPIHVYGVVIAGGNIIGLPIGNDETFLRRIADTCKALYPRPKALLLNYPHNPTTCTVERGFFEEVVGIARKYELMVVHDFAYGQTTFDGYKAPSFLAVPGAKEIGVEFTTMSKAYNMAGWRIGYCAGNPTLIRALGAIKGYYDYGIFQAIQIASIIALRECQDEAVAQAKVYEERRDTLVAGLGRVGWSVEKPKAGMFLWARIPEEFRSMTAMGFAERLLDEAEVMVSPGTMFGPDGEGYVRLALIENSQRLNQGVRNIKRTFAQWRTS